MFPAHHKLLEAKKLCRPNNIAITENCVNVLLQSLLDHTLKRIVTLQSDFIDESFTQKESNSVKATFYCSFGFDGTSGNSQFNQQLSETTQDDTLFVSALIPLRLVSEDGEILWNNPTPHSTRFCRPKMMTFEKETKSMILQTKENFDFENQNLENCVITLNSGKIMFIDFAVYLTLIDGKVLAHITNTPSYQRCPICKALPKEFNDIGNASNGVFEPD